MTAGAPIGAGLVFMPPEFDDRAAFLRAWWDLPAGGTLVYHRGFLARDRMPSPVADAIGMTALALVEGGNAIGVQRRRIKEGDRRLFDYLLIKRTQPRGRR